MTADETAELLVGTHGGLMLSLQVLYFAAGALLAVLAVDLWLRPHRRAISERQAIPGRSL